MKIHNDFTLYFRVIPSGKRVVYFYAYYQNGIRLRGRSTGETNKTAARVKVNRLMKEGLLITKKNVNPTFTEYAANWRDWEKCEYLKKRRKRSNLTKCYADIAKRTMDKFLIPYFGKMKMNSIMPETVESFFEYLVREGYKNTSINSFYATLRTMMREAVERRIIAVDPTARIGKLVNDRKEIKIITREEIKKLFVGDWEKVWNNNRIAYTANKLAALSGMRASEVIGLKGCYVYDDHIYIPMQFDKYGYRPTKNKDARNIPFPDSMINDLYELKKINGDGYLFSLDCGGKPVTSRSVYDYFRKACVNIGISETEIKERKLHLHAWRHFFNTEMLKGSMTAVQAQAVTGHKSDRMTEMYNHFDPLQFGKAKEVQEGLLSSGDK